MQRHPLLAQAFALSKAGRNAEAVLLVNQAVAQGDPESIYTLGEMKWRGGMVAQDLIQARELYRRAGELRHGRAAANYTNLLANGVAGERNWPLALRRLEQEARSDPQRREALLLIRQMQLTPEGHPETISQPDVLSERPKVSFFPRLFSQTECAYLLKLAAPGYMPSTVYDAQRRLVRDPIRTSDASTIHWQIEDPAVHALNQRLAAVTGTTAEQGEALQILRYSQSQQYRKHFDFVQRSDNQRAQTALVYLNEDYEGGETLFVMTGLKVKGRTGDALVFVNSLADGSVDPMSEHAGLPVERGTKLLASRWIREKRWAP